MMKIANRNGFEVGKIVEKVLNDNNREFLYVSVVNLIHKGKDYMIPNGWVTTMLSPMHNMEFWSINIGLMTEEHEFQTEIEIKMSSDIDYALETQRILTKEFLQGVFDREEEPKCACCGENIEFPVEITSEPEEIWCLHCAMSEGISFNLPISMDGRDEIEDGMLNYGYSYQEAYQILEDGEDFEQEDEAC